MELTEDERQLSRAFAADLNRITALAADEPPPCLDHRSVGARLLTGLGRLSPQSQARIVANARKGIDPGRPASAAGLNLDPALLAELRRLAKKRLDMLQPVIKTAIGNTVSEAGRMAARISRTTVEIQLGGELDTAWHREVNLADPVTLDCRWSTEEPGAVRGFWELRGPVWLGLGNPGPVIASGSVPDISIDGRTGGYFSLALTQYLPPTPPQTGAMYHLRVLPTGRHLGRSQGRSLLGLHAPSSGEFAAQPSTLTIRSAGVGPWSPPAVIRYGSIYRPEGTTFPDDMNQDVYRKAHFYFDWFKLVQDQAGPGDEEFHISGFVTEHNPQGALKHASFGPSLYQLDEDDRSLHPVGKRATVNLGIPNYTYWPRVLIAVISIMEEDDGGSLSDWQSALDEMLHDMLYGPFGADVTEFLAEMRDEIQRVQEELTEELAREVIEFLIAAITATVREYLTALLTLMVASIVASIAAGALDDFYGTRILSMFLETNNTSRIADGSAGHLTTSGPPASGGTFTGAVQADGSFKMDLTELQFLGLGGPLEGSPTSGIINIALHWEFDDRASV